MRSLAILLLFGGLVISLLSPVRHEPVDALASTPLATPGVRMPDGLIAFVGTQPGLGLFVTNGDGKSLWFVLEDIDVNYSPAWSPDGRQIAYTASINQGHEIRIVNPLNRAIRLPMTSGWGGYSPTWSPDGKQIAYVSEQDGTPEIYVMDADGQHQRRLTRDTPAWSINPAWSPSGRYIAFETSNLHTRQINLIRSDGSDEHRLVTNGQEPAWAPNGRQLAFVIFEGNKHSIHVIDADGSHERTLVENAEWPAWSPDSSQIVYATSMGITAQQLYVVNRDGTFAHPLFVSSPGSFSRPTWSYPTLSRLPWTGSKQLRTGSTCS